MKTTLQTSLCPFFNLFLVLVVLFLVASSSAYGNDGYRIMSYNIRNAKGLDNKTDYTRISGVILSESPEVVALQELDQKTRRSKGIDVLAEIAKLTQMYPSYGPAIDYDGGKYGIGILTKEKPLKVEYFPLPGREEQRCLLVVELKEYVFCCSHWSLTGKDRKTTVKIVTDKMKEQSKPVILCGDFNSEPDERPIKELKKDWALLNSEAATFPADAPKIHIDYICGSDPTGKRSFQDWSDAVVKTYVVDEKVASDHRPVVVELDPKIFD